MLTSLRKIISLPDLRGKILFTLFIMAMFRFGSHVPAPYIDHEAIRTLKSQSELGGALGFLNLFSGGALTQLAVFSLGIMPYITSSIIMQLLGVVIPKIEQWQKQGPVGQRKITQWTRYITVALAILQSTGLTFLFHNGGTAFFGGNQTQGLDLIPHYTAPRVVLIVTTLTAGTALVMWLGELISQRGIGNGMSVLIFTSVVSRLPFQGSSVRAEAGWLKFSFIVVLAIILIVGIIVMELGQRRIPVQFAKRVVGRRMYGGNNTYIPLKVNQAGVIPIIFASSMLYFPVILTNVMPVGGFWDDVRNFLDDNVIRSDALFHMFLYGTMIIFFAYFYTAISFDPASQADNIRKQGGFIPGIRPGPPTETYLNKVLNRITLPGAVAVMIIALLPEIFLGIWNINQFPFGGTSLLIAVGVCLETIKQVDSQLMMRNYEGFLKQ